MKKFIINDTTLRDGEQSAGILFSLEDKIFIAKSLDSIGVDEIEAGIPVMGDEEMNSIKIINESNLKAKISGWNRARESDIYSSLDIGLRYIHISVPISEIHLKYKIKKDFADLRKNIINILKILRKHNVEYAVGGEDSSRAKFSTLTEIIKLSEGEGAYKFRYSDTVGILNPLSTYNNIIKLKTKGDIGRIKIEIHTHNDFGMASANSVAALLAGADSLSGSISGIGERAGNCALEEVIAYFNLIEKWNNNFDFIKAKKLSGFISKITKRNIPVSKPIFGKNIFYHEAGIHTDGILKNPSTYEAFSPKIVGATRRFINGKHSGSAAIKFKLKRMGIELPENLSDKMLHAVKSESARLKRCLSDNEVKLIYTGNFKNNADKI